MPPEYPAQNPAPSGNRNSRGDPEAALMRGKAADAAWFAQHPKRRHRLRPALPGEAEAGAWIAAGTVAEGVRVRVSFIPPEPPPPGEAPEDAAARIFAALLASEPRVAKFAREAAGLVALHGTAAGRA